MSTQNPLVVPMTVEAWVVNDSLRLGRGSFFRAGLSYGNMFKPNAALGNAQPTLGSNDTNFTLNGAMPNNPNVSAAQYYDGVYLKWRLPSGLTHGQQNSVTGQTVFPTVPNRWLVIRYYSPTNDLASRTATAWIIESDYMWPNVPQPPNASGIGSLYVNPQSYAGTTVPTGWYVGRNVPASTAWTPGSGIPFPGPLTAQGPGNPSFGFYQPQCNNIFSFIDPLFSEGIVSTGTTTNFTLSYMVIGWYATASDDPLAGATDPTSFGTLLTNLGWSLPTGSDATSYANWSLLYGSVSGVNWQTTTLPAGNVPTGTLTVALGNTSIEALTALVTWQAAQPPVTNLEPELLEAFQLDCVDALDQPDGAATLAEKLQNSFFQRFGGGYIWEIVDAPNTNTNLTAAELAKEAAWLATLNQAQEQLDADINQLVSLQMQLYVMWWKYMNYVGLSQGGTYIPQLQTITDLQNAIDPTQSGGIAALTNAQLQTVTADQQNVPWGATPTALQAAIDAYATAQQLPASRVLKRAAAPSFYLPNNPVVLFAGAGASGLVNPPDTIMCRFGSAAGNDAAQLVSSFQVGTTTVSAATPGLTIPQPNISGISSNSVPWSAALLTSLVNEFFFLDSNNAAAVQAAIGGSTSDIATAMQNIATTNPWYPTAIAVGTWTANPWHPLLVLWSATYWPIEYGSWIFDGEGYVWNGTQASVSSSPLPLGGLIQIAPTAALNMEARLEAFLKNNPNLPPQEAAAFQALVNFISGPEDNNWDLISQGLDGFNEQLRLGTAGVFLSPSSSTFATTPPLTTLLGPAGSYPGGVGSYPPNLPALPTSPPASSPFQAWRSGQFLFTQLLLIDEWGQALWPVDLNNEQTALIVLPPSLSPIVTSSPATLTVASGPIVTSLQPPVAAAGTSGITLNVQGAGFAANAIVQWNGSPLTTTFVSASQLTASVPAASIASATTATVTVNSGSVSPGITFTVASGPAIASLSPSLMQAGMATSSTVPVTVSGVNFTGSSVIQWNGTAVTTTFVNATEVIGAVPASFTSAPGTASVTVATGATISPAATFTLTPGAGITSLSPAAVSAGGAAFTLTLDGVGFLPQSIVQWNGAGLATTYVSSSQLTAQVPAANIANAGAIAITEAVGSKIVPESGASYVQIPPSVLQPAQLEFELVSATNDSVVFGPANPGANPICGWVVPNHLDASLLAFDSSGNALGEMFVGMPVSGPPSICWFNAPGSPYNGLAAINTAIPNFGPFLFALSQQSTATFTAFLNAIDETLWTTVPMDASFDQSLAILIGRPLAMVRASLEFVLDGQPYIDPSWQYTFASYTSPITTYQFPVELGNIAQLNDGLIGYFVGTNYNVFNVVQEAGAQSGSYLQPIGANGNYIDLSFNLQTTYVSMLVDPRAGVHATTSILPDVLLSLPPQFVDDALAAMNVTFRIDGILTDQQISSSNVTTILMPVPSVDSGTWSWVENDEQTWTTYAIAPNDTSATLSNVAPVLRTGLLQLSSGVGASDPKNLRTLRRMKR